MSDPLDRLKGLTRYEPNRSVIGMMYRWDDGAFYKVAEVHHALQEARTEDAARVEPLNDCVEPAGTTAERPTGAVIAAERTE
jgi:hypothetical protein